jgi:hypothetical protein
MGEKGGKLEIIVRDLVFILLALCVLLIVSMIPLSGKSYETIVASEVLTADRDAYVELDDFDDLDQVMVVTDTEFFVEKESILRCSEYVQDYLWLMWFFEPESIADERLVIHVPPDA